MLGCSILVFSSAAGSMSTVTYISGKFPGNLYFFAERTVFRTLIKLRILLLLKFGSLFVFQNIIYTFVQTQLIMRIIARSKIVEMFNSVDSVGNQHYVFNIIYKYGKDSE